MTFLRPWFLLLILVPFLFKLFKEQTGAESPWRKVIDEKLLPYLLIHGSNATIKQRRFFKTLLWILLSVALAGPAWDKTDVPAHTYQPGTIIVLELSPAMTGENLKRAQQKIYDILDLLKGEQVGLVLYDRYGYTAGPLTFETDIIRNMVPYLDATVLPEKKSDSLAGFEQANRLFQNADIKEGRILFLTSGVFWDDDLVKTTRTYPHKIGILGIGPAEPHPVPRETGGFILDTNGQPLMVYFDPKKMGKVGAFEVMTPDDTDVQNLIDKTSPTPTENERLINQNMTLWRDRGGMLVALLLPFFALLFRKSVVLLLLLCLMRPAEASLWTRPDQEAYQQQMNGVAFYRHENYSRAESIFKMGKDTNALYNKGNALAFQQKIPEAIATYKEVLKKDPKHADARYNKEYLEKKLEEEKQKEEKQEEEKKKQEQEQKQEQQKDPENQQEQDPEQQEQQKQQEQQEPKQPEQEQDPQPPKQEPQPQEEQQQEQENPPKQDPEPPNAESEGEPEEEPLFDQESEQVLNQLPPDEDNVLRYRIRQQYNRYRRN